MDNTGLLMCSRYAVSPNRLEYCGPLRSSEVLTYLQEQTSDDGLARILSNFETMYPYLSLIAYENNIKDPFDSRVVEAYWIGNTLLNHVPSKALYTYFTNTLYLGKRMKQQDLQWLYSKIPQGALAHHSFHVLNIFTRTGHHTLRHTLSTMDACRIGWGVVKKVHAASVRILTSPLVLQKGKLKLDAPVLRDIVIPSWLPVSQKNVGSTYTFHWNVLCEKINTAQAEKLRHHTHIAISLANLTL